MKHWKKILSCLLAVLTLVGTFAMTPALAVDMKASGNINKTVNWSFKNNTLTISGKGAFDSEDVYDVIPWAGFSYEIEKLVIKDGITGVEADAFSYCENLKSVSVPASLREFTALSLEETAWYRALPAGPIYVGTILSGYKGDMPENYRLRINKGTTSVSSLAFYGQESLVSVWMPNSVIHLGDGAFGDCTKLAKIRLSKNIREAGYYAMDGTPWLDLQQDGVLYLGRVAYTYLGTAPKKTRLTIKKGTVTIAEEAFAEQSGIIEIKLPEGLTTIGTSAFAQTSLKTIYIPKSVKSIGGNELDCYKLEKVVVDPQNKVYASDARGALFNKSMTKLFEYPSGNKETSYKVPATVTVLPMYAFESCEYLQTLKLPASLKKINVGAFVYCSALSTFKVDAKSPYYTTDKAGSLLSKDGTVFVQYPAGNRAKSYTIPDSVKTIREYAFLAADNLKTVKMGDNVKTIKEGAFYYCTALKTIRFSQGLVNVDPTAFYETAWYYDLPDGVVYIGNILYDYRGELESDLKVKSGTTVIGIQAMAYCESLRTVVLPKSVKVICEGAFNYCDNLKTITIKNPNCKIYMSEDTLPYNATICAPEGSTAQAYAEQFGRKFVAI
ncbi:MAG: leucine-rich repeat domain-containing protein [Clostridia bacterium]|nr:leucine-rich repeat domain-containing protein [Clostridia bacterium]